MFIVLSCQSLSLQSWPVVTVSVRVGQVYLLHVVKQRKTPPTVRPTNTLNHSASNQHHFSSLPFWRCILHHLRNRLPVGGGCVYVLQMFFFVFFRPPKIWDNRSRERLNGFSWNFYQTIGGCSLKRRAAAWRKSCRRLANGECWWFA